MNIKQPHHPVHCPRCKAPTNLEPNRPFCHRCRFDLRYGVIKSNSGYCIYCENYRPLTDEHIFPRWIGKRYSSVHTKSVHVLQRPERHAFFETTAIPVHSVSDARKGNPYISMIVRNVCSSCNNGWMSRLQNKAKQLIKSLADGRLLELNELERNLLTRWCIMVSINLECYGDMLAAPQYQRTALMNGKIPSGWRIYVGIMKNTSCAGASHYRKAVVPVGIGNDEYLPIQSTYFCIERAAFHTLSSLGNRILNLGLLGLGNPEQEIPTRLIWPSDSPEHANDAIELERKDLVNIQRLFGYVE